MTTYRDPPKNTSRRSIGNLDGTSFGTGGVDGVRIKPGNGDFLQAAPTVVDNSYVKASNQVVLDLKLQNVGQGSGVFARKERDGTTYSFRRLQGGDGVNIAEVGDTLVVTALNGVDRFIKLKDVPSSYAGHNNKVLTVDETGQRIVFKPIDVPARITYSANPPIGPVAGDGWWDTESGTFFLFYVGSTSGQWVEVG